MLKFIRKFSAFALIAVVMATSVHAQEGIDVYHDDGAIDWSAVRQSGHGDFAYIKALDGEHTVDSRFSANSQGAAAAGVAWGPYQFFHPYSVASAQAQAEAYWSLIQNTGYTLTPAVDVEVYDGITDSSTFRDRLSAFLAQFEKLSGVKPIIYTMRSMISENDMCTYYAGYTLWQADPGRDAPVETGWPIGIWQYSWSGQVDGITAPSVDLDRTTDDSTVPASSSAIQPALQASSDYYEVSSLPQAANSRAGTDFYIRDHNGNRIGNHQIDAGDSLIILSVDYSTQLSEVLYPNYAAGGWFHGYIKNVESQLHNTGYNDWKNGSTNEPVYDGSGARTGTIYPNERATVLDRGSMTKVLYSTSKGTETKSGYVNYSGK